jgi:hypothetical protein
MNKTPSDQIQNHEDEILTEYHFDYQKAKPNRFAVAHKMQKLTVVLDDDVAQVFKTTESVNKVLRALIASMPTQVT